MESRLGTVGLQVTSASFRHQRSVPGIEMCSSMTKPRCLLTESRRNALWLCRKLSKLVKTRKFVQNRALGCMGALTPKWNLADPRRFSIDYLLKIPANRSEIGRKYISDTHKSSQMSRTGNNARTWRFSMILRFWRVGFWLGFSTRATPVVVGRDPTFLPYRMKSRQQQYYQIRSSKI